MAKSKCSVILLVGFICTVIVTAYKVNEEAQHNHASHYLVAAVDHNDLAAVNYWISQGADVNTRMRTRDHHATLRETIVGLFQNGKISTQKKEPLIYSVVSRSRIDPRIVRMLIQHGAEVNIKDRAYGMTPLMWAALQREDNKVVPLLLMAGARVNETSKAGLTPLYFAVLQNHTDTVRVLVQAGANPNWNKQSGSLLHNAVTAGNEKMVRLLLTAKIDCQAKDKDGKTALRLATELKQKGIIRLLKQATTMN